MQKTTEFPMDQEIMTKAVKIDTLGYKRLYIDWPGRMTNEMLRDLASYSPAEWQGLRANLKKDIELYFIHPDGNTSIKVYEDGFTIEGKDAKKYIDQVIDMISKGSPLAEQSRENVTVTEDKRNKITYKWGVF